jgi:putative ubiquitin-RnfH superfamily antitoxin RatB of RatAB toxin-antitoxin module
LQGDGTTGATVYFEHTQIGAYAKVAAIDAQSGAEVSIMGPATADPRMLEQAALRKLEAFLRRREKAE